MGDDALGAEVSQRFNYRNAMAADASGEAATEAREDHQPSRTGGPQPQWSADAPGGAPVRTQAIDSHIAPAQGPSSALASLAMVSAMLVIGGCAVAHWARKLKRRKNFSPSI